MVDKQAAIHFVSQVTHKIVSLMGEQRLDLPVALELIDTMKRYGFLDTHPEFFDAVKGLTLKVAEIHKDKQPMENTP